ncbi:MAG: acyclic terpene utilization AtuA family protein [Deltaproteobacteria bacterium]|nr:acyclic terpene utilization AtuA family protein [Deltaproteobacteria bacterium]
MSLPEFRILSPTAILGYGFPEASFCKGIERQPHLIGVDAGSTDPGPYYLGSGKSFTDRVAVKRDLRYILKAGIRNSIPVIIGTAGGAGAAPHLQWCREIVDEIAAEEQLSFTLGLISADIDKGIVHSALENGSVQSPKYVPELTRSDIDASVHIVAQMGNEPLMQALEKNCDVILAGRCYDPAVFAALPIQKGYDPGLATHLGKILECAAIAATPGSGADCVLGILKKDSFILEALSKQRKFTAASTAAHTLYEKSDPCHLPGPGGELNLEDCTFTEVADRKVEVRGSRFEPTDTYYVKLEGARPIGFRSISIAGVRDPIMIAAIDSILDEVKSDADAILKTEKIDAQVGFHVYGKNGVMGKMEPGRDFIPQELALITEVIGKTEQDAETVCSLVRSTLLHYGYKGRIATAGNLAFPFSPSDMRMGEAFEFSIYHLMELDDQNIFKFEIITY